MSVVSPEEEDVAAATEGEGEGDVGSQTTQNPLHPPLGTVVAIQHFTSVDSA